RPKPLRQLTVWLPAQPPPGDFDRHRSNPGVARFADSLLTTEVLAAGVGRRCQSRQTPHLTPIPQLSPGEEFAHEQPRALNPDRPKLHQLPYLLFGSTHRRLHLLLPLSLQLLNLHLRELHSLLLPLQPSSQDRRQLAAIPQSHRVKAPPQG